MTYQAEFRQPLKQLNPMGLRFTHPITVELYHVGSRPKKWMARIIDGQPIRWPDSKAQMQYPDSAGGAGALKAAVGALFEEQLTPWREWLTPEEQHERDHPTPAINKKPIATPRDNYGAKGV